MQRDEEYRSRMMAIVEELHAQGIGRYTSAPPIYRLAWRLGFHVAPPHYRSFRTLALEMGAGFGLLWALFMWVLFWRSDPNFPKGAITAAVTVFVMALLAGTGFGLSIAGYYRWQTKSLRLPPLP
jgi:hypothetical protein